MNIREISDVFKDTANQITAIKSYNFGWASDRTRSTNTEDYQELNEFPRVFFSVPTIIGSDQTRKQDTYQVTLFFDDLLGYNNEGDADLTLQLDKWAALQEYANYFVQRLNKVKQTILPNYLFIPEAPSITFDSFTGLQRMITVQLSFTLVVPTNCEPVVSKLVECIANIVTSSNLTAALKNIFELASTLQASSSLSANLQLTKFAASSLNTASSLAASALVSKLAASSLTGAGTLAAELTVTPAVTDLLLDTYPDAAAAYSLRKLRTAYTGSAIRVRRSSDNTEQNIGFVAGELDTVSLLAFCGVGNGFVTTWYDQSGNARNATQTTAANQPRIFSSGSVILDNGKPTLEFDGSDDYFAIASLTLFQNIGHINAFFVANSKKTTRNDLFSSFAAPLELQISFSASTSNRVRHISTRVSEDAATLLNSNTDYSPGIKLVSALTNFSAGTMNLFQNSSSVGSASLPSTGITGTRTVSYAIGSNRSNTASFVFDGNNSEIIIYTINQSSNRTGIETNINTNYAIY
jgi:hypothetical protein